MQFIGHVLKSVATVVLLLLLLSALFLAYRYMQMGQDDDKGRIAAKEAYLAEIAKMPLPDSPPNILFILYDDMGYGDIGVGARSASSIETPNIDGLAQSGVVLSDFYSPSPVCTPSRAGYLTGRLAPRAGLPNVVFPTGSTKAFVAGALFSPDTNKRLPEEEITLAELLQAANYRTAMVSRRMHHGLPWMSHRPSASDQRGAFSNRPRFMPPYSAAFCS